MSIRKIVILSFLDLFSLSRPFDDRIVLAWLICSTHSFSMTPTYIQTRAKERQTNIQTERKWKKRKRKTKSVPKKKIDRWGLKDNTEWINEWASEKVIEKEIKTERQTFI